MACVNVFKFKTLIFLVFILYIFVALIIFDVFKTTFSCTSPSYIQLSQKDFESIPEIEPMSEIELTAEIQAIAEIQPNQPIPEIEPTSSSFWAEDINFLNLRNCDSAETSEELDYLLNIRKLVLFAVHELNEPLKYTKCTKWWANPLDTIFHNAKRISSTHKKHSIKFHIQPGNLVLSVVIRQQMPPIGLGDTELEIIGTFEMQKEFQGKPCGNEFLAEDAAKTCLCEDNENFEEYNKITTELRYIWNMTDEELYSWHPDKSFLVPDYMNFTDYEWFVTSPGNTVQDIAELSYSSEYCGPDVKMLVMVSSAPGHFEQRKIIRETYANSSNLQGKGFKVVFLMGIPTDEQINDDVKHEASISRDIIQANYEDSYHNLSISHLSMYKWAYLNCIEGKNSGVTVPQFIFKADDDFLLNLDLAFEVAQQNLEYDFIGCPFCGCKPIRNVAYMTKYYTPRYMHISSSYSGYLSGVAYIMRTDVIPRLLHVSITTPFIHMDDAYVTGLLCRQLGIQPGESKLFTYARNDLDPCKSKQMACSSVLNTTDMIEQWNMLVEPMPSDCSLKDLQIKVEKFRDIDIRRCFFDF